MDLGLDKKRALVTASTRGLGLGIAKALAAEGCAVMLCGRDAERLKSEAVALAARGVEVHFCPCDLSTAEGRLALIAAVESAWSGIDIIVNNTGGPPSRQAAELGAADWQQQLANMVLPVTELTNHFLPGMRARQWGRVVTVASSGVVQPIPGLGLSNGLRAAIGGWSKTLATEVAADGVTVNMLLPGRIHTERVDTLDSQAATRTGRTMEQVSAASKASIPMGRYGRVEEFAAAAAFLASVQASYITGATIRVDGGMIRSV